MSLWWIFVWKPWKCNFLQFLWGFQLRTHGSDFEVGRKWARSGLPLICPKIWFFFLHIIQFWCFFSFFFPMDLHDVIFNATGWISIWSRAFFLEKNSKFRSIVDLHHYPCLIKKCSSLILTNLKPRIEPSMANDN
jgi:hypothetical protein